MLLRDRIRAGVDFSATETLEIGPLYRPFALKAEGPVIYVDHADTESLRKKYQGDPNFDVADIVEVDAVWGGQTLRECLGQDRKVDLVIASHVIEHVPDLITWLQELKSVLRSAGEIRLVIPDKRYTFDYLRPLTTLADVLDAYLRKARAPLPRCILDHVLNVRRVDTAAAWAGPLDEQALQPYHPFELAVDSARDALANGNYHDVHCWVFTPQSFATLMRQLAQYDLLDLYCHRFEDTLRDTLEFTVFLREGANKEVVLASWRDIEQNLAEAEQPSPAGSSQLEQIVPGSPDLVAQRGSSNGGFLSSLRRLLSKAR